LPPIRAPTRLTSPAAVNFCHSSAEPLDDDVVGEKAGHRAAAEIEQRQRGPAQPDALRESAAAHSDPDRRAHAVEV
jgi:hypothetical protein